MADIVEGGEWAKQNRRPPMTADSRLDPIGPTPQQRVDALDGVAQDALSRLTPPPAAPLTVEEARGAAAMWALEQRLARFTDSDDLAGKTASENFGDAWEDGATEGFLAGAEAAIARAEQERLRAEVQGEREGAAAPTEGAGR